MSNRKKYAALAVLFFVSALALKADFSQSQGGGTIKGTVKFTGTSPKGKKVQMTADAFCSSQHPKGFTSNETQVNKNGTVPNVFVYVKSKVAGKFSPPKSVVKLDQKGCWYNPRVIGVQAGQTLEFVNSDSVLHNVHGMPKKNSQFNFAQPVKGMKNAVKFTKAEIPVPVKCDVHPWMKSYIGVVSHPFFAVTGATGSFTIKGLPAGTHTLEAWHEKFGKQTASVTIKAGETKTVDISFKK